MGRNYEFHDDLPDRAKDQLAVGKIASSKRCSNARVEHPSSTGTDHALRLVFGRNLGIARQHACLTQREICASTGISQPYYSECERGLMNVGTDNIAKIAVVLGVFPHNLLNPLWPKELQSGRNLQIRPTDPVHLTTIHGPNIKAARELAGLTQRGLCKLTGVSQSYLSQVENGTWNIGIDNLAKVARALGVRPHDLLNPAGLPAG
jgi:transcriptional regulator with XRE-family HTH domain